MGDPLREQEEGQKLWLPIFTPAATFEATHWGRGETSIFFFFFFLCKGVCLDVCLEVCVLVARKGHRVPWDYSDRRELPCGPWGLTPAPLGGVVWEGQYSLGKVPCDGEVAPEGVGREADTEILPP